MRVDWLEDIVAVLEAGSLTDAARRRNVSQPAFSRRLRAAEDALGTQLIDRSTKPARLRPGLEALAPRLRSAASEIRQLRVDLRLAATDDADSIVITAQHSLATTRAAAIIARIDDVPSIQGVRLRSANRDNCIAMLMVGEADIAIVHRTPTEPIWHRPSEVEVAGLAAERLIPVATEREAARILSGTLRLVGYPGDVFLGQVFAERIAPRLPEALRLVPRAETALAPAAHSLAREGSGVAWLPETMARTDIAAGHLHDLSGQLPSTLLELVGVRTLRRHAPALDQAWTSLVSLEERSDGAASVSRV
ncbi:LysR family transcriptional regulator [Pseudaestuariivita sp.]|uniref:LysR family transcriptional regulator n=1 Tax=Pseudaestuariivita sp. TaxID=2211669 RepID=UPI004057EEB5